jgi:hypothetical protein
MEDIVDSIVSTVRDGVRTSSRGGLCIEMTLVYEDDRRGSHT